MAKFKKLALICTAILASSTMALATTGCDLFAPVDGSESVEVSSSVDAGSSEESSVEESSSESSEPEAVTYTIKFVDEDGVVLQESEVEEGTLPAYEGAIPTKAGDAQYSWEFDGWNETIVEAAADAVYTVKFKQVVNKYTITFIVDGTETTQEMAYGETPVFTGSTDKAADAQYTYTFDGWNAEIVAVTGAATYTAQYSTIINKYMITFLNDDGTQLQATEVEYGTVPTCAITPTKESTAQYTYTFKGWDKEVVAVGDTETYTAVYESVVNKYTITFLNDDGTQLQATEVEYGTVPTCATTPTKEATAQYTYTFKGWDKDVVAVIGAEIYTAVYESVVNKYTITFNVDGTETTQEVAYGEVPVFNGSTDKVGDAQYIYIFNDWQPALAAVTGETSYTASYYTLDAVNRTFEEGKAYGFEAVAEVNDAVVVKYTDEGLVEPENGGEYCVKFALAGSGPDIALVGNNLTSGATVTFDIYLAYDVEDERASYHMTHSSGEEYGYGVDPDIIGVSGVTAIWTNVWNTFTMDVTTVGSCVFTIKLPMNDVADYDLYTIYIDNVKVSVESTEGFDYANRTFEDGEAYGFSIVSSAEKGVAIKYTDEGLAVPLNGGEYCTKFVLSGTGPEIAFIGENLTVGSTVTFQIYFAYDTEAEGADYKMTHPSGKEYGYGVDPNLYGVDGENAIWTNVWNTFTITVTNEGSVSFKIAIPQADWNDYGLYTIYIDNIVVNEA